VSQRFVGVLALVSALGCVALLVWALLSGLDLRAREHYGSELRGLRSADGRLDELVLEARLGLLGHYDPLVSAERSIAAALAALAIAPPYVSPRDEAGLETARAHVAKVAAQKSELLERFKSQHAAFRNSARYFPSAVSAFIAQEPGEAGRAAAGALLGTALKFLQSSEASVHAELEGRIAAFDALRPGFASSALSRAANHVLLHARVLLVQKPPLDDLMERFLALPSARSIEALDAVHARAYDAALREAEQRRLWLFALALIALSSSAGYVVMHLRRSGLALAHAMVQLEEANQLLREERAKEREIHELKSRFAARTSHEFRTPLSVIMSSAELLANYGQRFPEHKREEHRARIETSVRDMTEMLDEILAAWREDGGERTFSPEQLDVVALCRDVTMQTSEAVGAGERVVVECERPRIEAVLDPRLARHIITNLVTNALKYSSPDSRVVVALREERDELVLSVLDHGRGIPAEDQPHLFEDFHRASNVDSIPGTGLGLAVVRRAAEIHGGSITVASQVGEGSTFVVRLPKARP
jgi:signal transduction histidine kinase